MIAMAKALYMEDSYLKEWDAKVVSANGKFIVLDSTAFYPKSGGVEWDTGTMTRKSDGRAFKVVYTGKFKGEISHEVDAEGLKNGDEIHCTLDWNRRYLLMRYHTAAHVVSGVFHNEYGYKITGNQLTPEKGRIDFDMEDFDVEQLKKGIARSNELVGQNLEVEIYTKSRKEAENDQKLFKLAVGFPHVIKEIRIVDIKGFDAQADGGCHVRSLKEIGTIRFEKAVNKGKNNRRLYFTLT